MRPPRGCAARPAELLVSGTAELVLGALSPNTEAELLGGGMFDDAAGAWLLASPGKGATPGGFTHLDARPTLLPRGALRCIDGTHTAGCTACSAPPADGDESAYELTGEVGKKNGEKRLRSQLSRTMEWGSLDERTRVAQMCEAAGPAQARLAAALRARHCAELRKSDLMFLSRVWGYRSDVWSRRKDRRYAPRDGAAPPPPPPPLPAARAADAQPCSLLDRVVREPSANQLAAVHAEVAGPLRQLSERSIEAFSIEAGPSEMLLVMSSRGTGLPASVLQVAAAAVAHSSANLTVGQNGLARLLDAARLVHADVQCALLRLTADDSLRPAFTALAAKEAPWELLMRDYLLLSDFAIAASAGIESVTIATVAQQSSTDGDNDCGDDEAIQLMVSSCRKTHVAHAGRLCMEMATRISSMLAQLKLASYAVYLNAVSLSVGLLVGHLTAVQAALQRTAQRMQVAQGVLVEAGVAPASPDLTSQAQAIDTAVVGA